MPDTCYFDGRCGFCVRSARVLRRLDWLGRLRFLDLHAVPASELPVPIDAAMQGMPMRTGTGRVLVGFPAVRRALRATPVGFLPALVLHMPGVSHAAARWYERRAATRGCTLAPDHPLRSTP